MSSFDGTDRISPVDRKIFWWLLRYPLLRVEDLAPALGVSANTVYRHLTRLVDEGLAQYITPSLDIKTTCRLYHLSNEGILTAAALEQGDAAMLAGAWGAHEQGLQRLIPRLPALVPLQNVVNGLIERASTMLAHVEGYRADISWHWQRDYQYTFSYQEKSLTWKADAALLFYRKAAPLIARAGSVPATVYHSAFLFFDAGLSGLYDHQLITQRLETLLRYRDHAERRGQGFPPLLVVTQTPLQQETWQRCAADLALARHATPLSGAIVCLEAQAAPQSAWTLPWQQLSVRGSCRLRDLFSPLSEEALPPGLLKRQEKATPSEPSTTNSFLRGNFSRRAHQLSATLAGEEDIQEREVVALLSLCLSQRHRDLLHLCYAHPLLEQAELTAFSGLQPDSVRRYLSELRRYDCIEECATELGTRWYVSERGLRFLAASLRCPLRHLAMRGEASEALVQRCLLQFKKRIGRVACIYAFFARLAAEARGQSGHQLLWWEMGGRCERRFQDHGAWLTIQPNASFAYKAPSTHLRAWIEWEEEESSDAELVEKMRAYARYAYGREWAAEGLQSPPVLLIIAPEERSRLEQIAREQLAAPDQIVRATSACHVVERGPLAAIWSQVLPLSAASAKRGVSAPSPRCSLLDLSTGTASPP